MLNNLRINFERLFGEFKKKLLQALEGLFFLRMYDFAADTVCSMQIEKILTLYLILYELYLNKIFSSLFI